MNRNAVAADMLGAAYPVVLGVLAARVAGVDPTAAMMAVTFGIALLAATMGPARMGGAHLSPALSLGLLLTGKVDTRDFLGHALAQGAGLMLAVTLLQRAAA